MPIQNNYIAGTILVLGILLTIWCLVKGEGYAKQIKWILMFYFLAAFVTSEKFDTLKGLQVIADMINVDKYVGQLKEVTADSIEKLNETHELKMEAFRAMSSAKLEKAERLLGQAKALMRLSVESAVYDEATKINKDVIRQRVKTLAPHLFENESERDRWSESMLKKLDKESEDQL
ncbi:MAG TPA: hypothetical protein EYP19_12010 [Desulfobacterales bacterium]|jgi:hypothetical protein|nr:hypothetical protein [Desulfobacterales bacterium]